MNLSGSSRQAHAQELLLAAPQGSADDIYLSHQAVWQATSHQRAVASRPALVYRVDDGMIRVRVSDCAMRGTKPVKADLAGGDVLALKVRLALWLQVPYRTEQAHIEQRIHALLEQAGLHLLDFAYRTGIACGRKVKQSSFIELPVASIEGRVRVMQPEKAIAAWVNGIGKGKRFGFGMLDFSASA